MRQPDAAAAPFWSSFAAALRPPERLSVAEWAARHRIVPAESGSPEPGRWRNDLVPYLREIMEALSLDDPTETVVLMKSAQVGGSECGLNLFGWLVCQEPSPILIVLPTVEEGLKYNRVKLGPAIDACDVLRTRVSEQISRDETGSTTTFKRFRGGFCQITGANSSAGLQMISARALIFEEVSEYPADAGGRGEPTALAIARSKGWQTRGRKIFYCSTPNLVGECRVSAEFEASDQRRFYVPCPECGHYQTLAWERLRWTSETAPHQPYFDCLANGCRIEPGAGDEIRRAMVAAGAWVRTYPDGPHNPAPPESFAPEDLPRWRARPAHGRSAGFAIWQAYSPFVPWEATVAEYHAALGDARKLKVFTQQALGRAWEEKGDAPDHLKLMERRETWPTRRLPPGVLVLTMAVDVQADRLEWAVYGWGRHYTAWLIDKGVIEGDPNHDVAWDGLRAQMLTRYADAWNRAWPIDSVGVDAKYLSQRVYRFVQAWAHTGRVLALNGRPGWRLPAIAAGPRVDVAWNGKAIGKVAIWHVGTWDLKSATYAALRLTLEGRDADGRWKAGALISPAWVDEQHFMQLTAEMLQDRRLRTGRTEKEWVRTRARNEQLDLAVYARALAHRLLDGLTLQEWDALEAERCGAPADLQQELWGSLGLVAPPAPPPAPQPPPPPPAETGSARDRPLESARPRPAAAPPRDRWLARRRDWLRRPVF
ncbi:MAG: phage terminase large subunit family protein [Burkholderiaceae bacterium]|nr:phage terminase large subunit family protein [Burkholderiaceae bacterium]